MSERGSYITNWFYCDICEELTRKSIQKIFKDFKKDGFFAARKNTIVKIKGQPIYAGRISGGGATDEIFIFKEIANEISKKICDDHTIRIAVLCDSQRDALFSIQKNNVTEVHIDQKTLDSFIMEI